MQYHRDLLETILERPDLDANQCDANGLTALMIAVGSGWVDGTERLLLGRPDVRTDIQTPDGHTAADFARLVKDPEDREIILELLGHDDDEDLDSDAELEERLTAALRQESRVNYIDKMGEYLSGLQV